MSDITQPPLSHWPHLELPNFCMSHSKTKLQRKNTVHCQRFISTPYCQRVQLKAISVDMESGTPC